MCGGVQASPIMKEDGNDARETSNFLIHTHEFDTDAVETDQFF